MAPMCQYENYLFVLCVPRVIVNAKLFHSNVIFISKFYVHCWFILSEKVISYKCILLFFIFPKYFTFKNQIYQQILLIFFKISHKFKTFSFLLSYIIHSLFPALTVFHFCKLLFLLQLIFICFLTAFQQVWLSTLHWHWADLFKAEFWSRSFLLL